MRRFVSTSSRKAKVEKAMAVLTMRALNKKLNKFAVQYPRRARGIKRKVAEFAIKELVLSTPVDTGKSRGSWRVTQNRPSRAQPRLDKSGGRTIAHALTTIRGIKGSADIYVTNVADHTELINNGTVIITKARPHADPGFVERAVRRANIAAAKTRTVLDAYRR